MIYHQDYENSSNYIIVLAENGGFSRQLLRFCPLANL
jgi:hypothetical protein